MGYHEVYLPSQVQTTRKEILRLISKLYGDQAGGGVVLPKDVASRSISPTSRTRQQAHLDASISGIRRPPDASGRALGGDAAAILQALEARLARVERQLAENPTASNLTKEGGSGLDPNATFGGIISGDLLSDMLQLVSSNGLSGVFRVEANGTHTLYFLEGQLKHAESGKLTGEDAFYAVFALQQGRYNFTETTELPDEVTINGNTQFLILEALRKIDETRAA